MTQTNLTEPAVVTCVEAVIDPEIGRSLGELNMLNSATVADDGSVSVELELSTPA